MNKTPNELVADFLQLTIIPRLLEMSPRQRWITCDLLIKALAEFSQKHGKDRDHDRHN